MEHLTMQQLEDLGFTIVKSYVNDELMTQRRQRGSLIIETTWRATGEFVSQKIKTTTAQKKRPNTSSTWECFTKSEIHAAVGRSEQLRAFKEFLQSEYHLPVSNRMVDEFEQKQSS